MDYELSGIAPDMNNHTFEYDEPELHAVDKEEDVVNGIAQSQKPCLVDLLLVGWDKLAKSM
jgi:hypothetical protein